MTPNNMTPGLQENGNKLAGARAASTICLLAGIWFFVSPWVYGAPLTGNAWNSWIVGALMFIFGCARVARPAYSTGLSWANMVLGIWAFFSPWIYGYVFNSGRFINSLCVGVIVFVLSIAAATMSRRTLVPPARHA
ncbi:MAG TPA: SPW repeat protein [Bryobacteraceae bacterium]|jgi:hypothetical protein|nr:SPW repeat protein [Bryobacteraceae bacterium]